MVQGGRRLEGALIVGALAALVLLAPTGSARVVDIKRYDACLQYSSAPLCSTTGVNSVLPGGSSVQLKLTITNQRASNQALGSVNLNVPSGSGIAIETTKAVTPSMGNTVVPQSSSQIQLRNLNLAPDTSMNVTFWVTTPCSGTNLKWETAAKQSNNFLGTGNDFIRISFAGQFSDIQPCYHVEFLDSSQPKTTVVGATITDAEYSRGGPIEVGVFDNSNVRVPSCAIAAAGSEVTITKAPSAGSLGGDASEPLACSAGGLVATFDDLSIGGLSQSALPASYTLTASGLGTTGTSVPFDVIYGVPCTTSGCPSFTTSLDDSKVTSSATAGSFTFLAILPTSIPSDVYEVSDPDNPPGCAFYRPVSGAFEAIEGRTSNTGELRFTYFLKKTDIEKLYGSTSGQQFVPLCAGAAWVDSTGAVKRCDDDGAPLAWVGKELAPRSGDGVGLFTGKTRAAVCDEATGLFWGILGSFQDYTGANTIDPETSPTVTGWGSGGNFRHFDVRVPAPWDWKMG